MSKRQLMLTTLMAVLAGALLVAACSEAPSPTAPPPPTEKSTAAPGTAGLVVGQPEDKPEAGVVQPAPGAFHPAAAGGQAKVEVCHQEGNGSYHVVTVAEAAVPAHEGHGDWLVGPEVCDDLDNDCNGEVDEGGVCVPCPAGGIRRVGACWYLGSRGQSCLDVCSSAGLSYDPATRLAGSDAPDSTTCGQVLDALVGPGPEPSDVNCSGGCLITTSGGPFWCSQPATTADARHRAWMRACACA